MSGRIRLITLRNQHLGELATGQPQHRLGPGPHLKQISALSPQPFQILETPDARGAALLIFPTYLSS